ncbi:MAG: hypothetical protein HRT52_19635 [Colwellia sp.]|nr:hypothetical protein [Colwellia sp.]
MNKVFLFIVSLFFLFMISDFFTTHSSEPVASFVNETVSDLSKDVPHVEHQQEKIDDLNNELIPENQVVDAEELLSTAIIIRKCRGIPRTDDALSDWLNAAYEKDETDSRIDSVLSRFEQCKLVSAKADYISKFIIAAEMGLGEAGPALWHITETNYMQQMGFSNLDRNEYIKKKNDFINLKYRLVEKLAVSGDERSIRILADAYKRYDPDTGGQNYSKALAFTDLFLAITLNNESYQNVDWVKQRLINKMTQKEIDEASIQSISLIESLIGANISTH